MENSSRKENTNGAMQGEEIVFFVSKILHQRFFYSSSRTSGDRFWTCRTKKAGYKLGLQCQTPNRIYYLKKCILPKATKITAWLEKLRRISLLFPRNRNPDKSSSVQPLKERSPVSPLYFSIIFSSCRDSFFSVNEFISIFSRAKIILGIQEHHPFLSDIFSLLRIITIQRQIREFLPRNQRKK